MQMVRSTLESGTKEKCKVMVSYTTIARNSDMKESSKMVSFMVKGLSIRKAKYLRGKSRSKKSILGSSKAIGFAMMGTTWKIKEVEWVRFTFGRATGRATSKMDNPMERVLIIPM
jgi:hypothetical protein